MHQAPPVPRRHPTWHRDIASLLGAALFTIVAMAAAPTTFAADLRPPLASHTATAPPTPLLLNTPATTQENRRQPRSDADPQPAAPRPTLATTGVDSFAWKLTCLGLSLMAVTACIVKLASRGRVP